LSAYILKKVENDENAYFVLMLAILAVAAQLSQTINLPGIVGAFLAGLAVNAAVRDKPAKGKLEFFGNSLFIPVFFIVTGFLINPVTFVRTLTGNFPLVAAVIGALLIGKLIAAQIAGRAFAYTPAARMTMWSLTLPQVAATLAATLVAFDTFNSAGQRLVDERLLNVVLVVVLATSILGPVLTEHFAPRMLSSPSRRSHAGCQSLAHEGGPSTSDECNRNISTVVRLTPRTASNGHHVNVAMSHALSHQLQGGARPVEFASDVEKRRTLSVHLRTGRS
jgi:Kef-type K+ transport system membrane component KefB